MEKEKSMKYGMWKCTVWAIILMITLFLSGCFSDKQAEYQEYYQKLMEGMPEPGVEQQYDIAGHAEDISVPEALPYFQDLYGLSALEDQSLFWDGENLQLSFYFSADAPFHQVDTARSYVIKRLVVRIINNNSPTPYELLGGDIPRDIPSVSCRVYLGDNLMLQDNYADKQLSGYYENRNAVFAMRSFVPDDEAAIQELASRYLKQPELTFQKGLYEGIWIVRIATSSLPDPKKLEAFLEDWKKSGVGSETCYFVLQKDGEPYYRGFN